MLLARHNAPGEKFLGFHYDQRCRRWRPAPILGRHSVSSAALHTLPMAEGSARIVSARASQAALAGWVRVSLQLSRNTFGDSCVIAGESTVLGKPVLPPRTFPIEQ